MDPTSFPEPEKVKLDRDMGQLNNLRRAPGPQGRLHKLSGPGGISKYLNADQSGFTPFPTSMKVQWDGELPDLKQKS
ncbi:hypothetical protein EYZ11_006123 [Aspergillus tanneri]|uniref:Uncharacterized protein n=1 Tax=Aspergillus tanneri TaxID=1220188 RepID=A0A4V3UPA8_9EURO|nr:hypothetical protein EYZ11_006123 [Aspergillus tanneri]